LLLGSLDRNAGILPNGVVGILLIKVHHREPGPFNIMAELPKVAIILNEKTSFIGVGFFENGIDRVVNIFYLSLRKIDIGRAIHSTDSELEISI